MTVSLFDPNADSDDVWARRRTKRIEAVRAVIRSEEYIRSLGLVGFYAMPPQPDPHARTSKRFWEKSVQVWRLALREICEAADRG